VFRVGNTMLLLVGHRTCDSQVTGLSPGQAPLRSGFAYTCVPLSPSSIIWYRPRGEWSLWLGR